MLLSLGKLTVLHATAAAESNTQQKFGSCAQQHRDRLLLKGKVVKTKPRMPSCRGSAHPSTGAIFFKTLEPYALHLRFMGIYDPPLSRWTTLAVYSYSPYPPFLSFPLSLLPRGCGCLCSYVLGKKDHHSSCREVHRGERERCSVVCACCAAVWVEKKTTTLGPGEEEPSSLALMQDKASSLVSASNRFGLVLCMITSTPPHTQKCFRLTPSRLGGMLGL